MNRQIILDYAEKLYSRYTLKASIAIAGKVEEKYKSYGTTDQWVLDYLWVVAILQTCLEYSLADKKANESEILSVLDLATKDRPPYDKICEFTMESIKALKRDRDESILVYLKRVKERIVTKEAKIAWLDYHIKYSRLLNREADQFALLKYCLES